MVSEIEASGFESPTMMLLCDVTNDESCATAVIEYVPDLTFSKIYSPLSLVSVESTARTALGSDSLIRETRALGAGTFCGEYTTPAI
jgi:hypothetical protein